MKTHYLHFGLIAALFSLLLAPCESQVTKPESVKDKRFDLNFPGGNPGQLIEAIEKASGQRPNVIVSENAELLNFPKFQLRDVTNQEIFSSLEILLQGSNLVVSQPQPSIYGVSSADTQVKIGEVSRILAKYKIEDVTSAIKAGWATFEEHPEGILKFHPETKLLIFSGTSMEKQIFEDVISKLTKATEEAHAEKEAMATDHDSSPIRKILVPPAPVPDDQH